MYEVLELYNKVIKVSLKLTNLCKYKFLELHNVSHFPPELTTVLYRKLSNNFFPEHFEQLFAVL